MPEPVLEVKGLRKEFGTLVAVDDVSFALPEGGSLAIVGESGSGKTTVAKMIVGLERPTAGVIQACGAARSTPARATAAPKRPGGGCSHPGGRRAPARSSRVRRFDLATSPPFPA